MRPWIPLAGLLSVWCTATEPAAAADRLTASVQTVNHPPSTLRQGALETLERAASFYRDKVSSHGGYVYHYSLDLKVRWGEGLATVDQIWVQPPGTPTVGMAFLRAFHATGDTQYLDAAKAAAEAIVYGQLKSGGWTNCVDFDPRGARVAAYRNGRGRGKNNSSLDDGQTQSALRFLILTDEALDMRHAGIHQAARIGLDALLAAQFPNGAFPQVWTKRVARHPVLRARYPDYDWRTEGRIKNYWDMYTLNDNVCGYVAETLIAAHRVYLDDRYRMALRRLGDFLVAAQMPDPQPGWAQQYNYDMQPIWARKFEPPGVSGDETQEAIETLLRIHAVTSEPRFLDPIPSALEWLERSQLPDGQVARYYELQSNRPLYMSRRGDAYSLTYDDSQLPKHYGWKTHSRVKTLRTALAAAQAGTKESPPPALASLEEQVRDIIQSLDAQGRWVTTWDGERLVGQPKFRPGAKYLSSELFSRNVTVLSEYLERTGSEGRSER